MIKTRRKGGKREKGQVTNTKTSSESYYLFEG
jgi:hypothetical protein